MALGAAIRLSYVLQSDFPLNDGALFYLMTRELQQAHYRLPAYTAYNGAGIPFAYPPLGFYLAGLAADLTGAPLLTVMRFLPFLFTALALPAFYALSGALLGSRRQALLALTAFALMSKTFQWQLMGGGVTRAPGFFLAILALRQGYLMFYRRQPRRAWTTGLLAGAALLCHLEMGYCVAYSLVFFFLLYGRNRAGVRGLFLAGGAAAAVSAPWWAIVIARHGAEPFLAAAHHGERWYLGLMQLALLRFVGEPLFPVLAGLSLLGILVCLGGRRYLLPGWLGVMYLLDSRGAHITGVLPLALLAALGIAEGLLPLLRHLRGPGRPAWRFAGPVLGFLLVYAALGALEGEYPLLTGLSAQERNAMGWVAAHTPEDSAFLVIPSAYGWGSDRSAEWFPVLAGRRSVATVQGYEWLPGFPERTMLYGGLLRCLDGDAAGLEQWAQEHRVTFSHIYIGKRPDFAAPGRPEPGAILRAALRRDPRYRLLYDGSGATVWVRQTAS